MRYFITLALWLLGTATWALDWEDRQVFGSAEAPSMLRIISSTDTDLFVPIIQSFLTTNPNVSIEYLVTGTADLDTRFREAPKSILHRHFERDGLAVETGE